MKKNEYKEYLINKFKKYCNTCPDCICVSREEFFRTLLNCHKMKVFNLLYKQHKESIKENSDGKG
jgi:hypothetical protein